MGWDRGGIDAGCIGRDVQSDGGWRMVGMVVV